MLKRLRSLAIRALGGVEARARPGSDTLQAALAAANLTGVPVTERNALTLTSAFACINVLATDLAFFPLRVRQVVDRDRKIDRPDHPADALLRFSPDGERTTMRARQAWYGHTFGWGNGYQRVERDLFGRPAALTFLDPSDTEPRRRKSDDRLYYLSDEKSLRPENVLHLAGLGYDGLKGYSPVRLARQAIALGLATESCGAALFGNGLIYRGMIRHPATMSEEAWDRLRTSIEQTHLGLENSHRFLLLEEGTEFVQTSMSPDDAQFLATRQYQVIEICRIWRVPPHKVMDYSQAGSAYRALEEANLDYVNTTLGPWCEQIEQELALKLLTPEERADGFVVEHSLAALLRGDSKAQIEYWKGLRDLGVATPNWVAAEAGINPIGPEGDVRLVPSGYVPLQSHAARPEAVAASPADAVAPVAAGVDLQSLALNGAQVEALLSILDKVSLGTIPKGAAKPLIQSAFPTIDGASVSAIVDPIEVNPPPAEGVPANVQP